MKRWLLTVAALGFLAGSLVWEMRASYAPLTPGVRLGAPLVMPLEQRGYIVVVRARQHRCDVQSTEGRTVATFECTPKGGF